MNGELEEVIRKIRRRGLVQLPEGLVHLIPKISDLARKFKKEVIFDIDPTYGACDIRLCEARASSCDTIIHVGHAKILDVGKVLYVPWRREANVEKIIEKLRKIKGRKCVATTINFAWLLDYVKEVEGVVLGRGSGRVPGEGIVLGCDTSVCNVQADINIFIGDGYFHPLAMGINTGRETLAIRPHGGVERIAYNKFLKRRLALIGMAEGRNVGIIISSKPGQNRMALAMELRDVAEENGYSVRLYISDYLYPHYLTGLPEDFFVFTGCPRVATDDTFEKPVLTPEEFLLKLGYLKKYRIDWFTSIKSLPADNEG